MSLRPPVGDTLYASVAEPDSQPRNPGLVVRPPISGRVVVTALIIWPVLELWKAPELTPWFILIGLFLLLMSFSLWSVRIHCDDTTVEYYSGRGSRSIRRDSVAAVALGVGPIGGCAFLGSDGLVLLTVPGGVWRRRDLVRMVGWLEVPIATAR